MEPAPSTLQTTPIMAITAAVKVEEVEEEVSQYLPMKIPPMISVPPLSSVSASRVWSHSLIRGRILDMIIHPDCSTINRKSLARIMTLNSATFADASARIYKVIRGFVVKSEGESWPFKGSVKVVSIHRYLESVGASSSRIAFYIDKVRDVILPNVITGFDLLDFASLRILYPKTRVFRVQIRNRPSSTRSVLIASFRPGIGMIHEMAIALQMKPNAAEMDFFDTLFKGNPSSPRTQLTAVHSVRGISLKDGLALLSKATGEAAGCLAGKIPIFGTYDPLSSADELIPYRQQLAHLESFECGVGEMELGTLRKIVYIMPKLGSLKMLTPSKGTSSWEIPVQVAMESIFTFCPSIHTLRIPFNCNLEVETSDLAIQDMSYPLLPSHPNLRHLILDITNCSGAQSTGLEFNGLIAKLVGRGCFVKAYKTSQGSDAESTAQIVFEKEMNAGREAFLVLPDFVEKPMKVEVEVEDGSSEDEEVEEVAPSQREIAVEPDTVGEPFEQESFMIQAYIVRTVKKKSIISPADLISEIVHQTCARFKTTPRLMKLINHSIDTLSKEGLYIEWMDDVRCYRYVV